MNRLRFLPVLALITASEPQFSAVQALCTALFCLFHWPCGPTVLTVYRETGSLRWTALSAALPTAIGSALCIAVKAASTLL